jgi:general secretion pathway protein J
MGNEMSGPPPRGEVGAAKRRRVVGAVSKKDNSGFTLVEMLVALFVFALLTGAGVTVLRSTANSQEALRGREAELAEFQRLRAILKSDLSQAAVRRTRDERGRPGRLVFAGATPTGGNATLLRFVRRGWENPDRDPRASLQQVEYRLNGGRLERVAQLALDGGAAGPVQVLADDIRSAELSFLSDGQWIATVAGTTDNPLPQAVRLDLVFDGIGRISQIFAVTGEAQ